MPLLRLRVLSDRNVYGHHAVNYIFESPEADVEAHVLRVLRTRDETAIGPLMATLLPETWQAAGLTLLPTYALTSIHGSHYGQTFDQKTVNWRDSSHTLAPYVAPTNTEKET